MSQTTIVLWAFVAAVVTVTSAISPEEKLAVKAAVRPLLQECGQDLGISLEDMDAAKEKKDVSGLNPCLFSCFFKKTGIIDENNMFDAAAAIEKSAKFVSGEDSDKLSEIAKTCTAVNDQAVSDANGCDRAKYLFDCFIEQKHSLFD